METAEVKRRYDAVSDERTTIEPVWETIERVVMPYRGRFFYKDSGGEHSIDWSKRDIYDSTAVMAAQSLAASLHSSLTTPAIKWFELTFRDKEMLEDKEAREWLEKSSQRTYDALMESNFGLEVNECYQDIVGYGTAFVTEEEETEKDWNGLNFLSVPLKDSFFELDHKGHVYRYYRRFMWTPLQIISKFGKAGVPQEVLDKADKTPDEQLLVVFAIYERPKLRQVQPFSEVARKLAPKRRAFGTKYILHHSCELLGTEGGYYELPVYVPRWRRTNDSMWGNSPAMVALAQILTLNEVVKMTLTAAEKAIDPPLLTEERAILGDLELGAGDLSVVRKIDGVKPLESAARFDVSQLQIEDARAAIRQMFFMDQLELKESPQMTATEVNVRYEMMQRLLGPTLDRLQSDFFDPMIKRTFNIMLRAGQFDQMPESLKRAKADLDIEYQGPMARSQKSDSVINMQRFVQVCGEAAELSGKPDALDAIDFTEYSFEVGDMLSIPSAVLKDRGDATKEKKNRDIKRQQVADAEVEMAKGQAMQANVVEGGNGNQAGNPGGIGAGNQGNGTAGAAGFPQ